MARFIFDGTTVKADRLGTMDRKDIRRIVEAGSAAAIERMKSRIREKHYRPPRSTGDMMDSVGANEYRETIGGGRQDVYPLGNDRKGERNATKAFVINYGRGGARKTPHMRDYFITKDSAVEEIVQRAMEQEFDRIAAEKAR